MSLPDERHKRARRRSDLARKKRLARKFRPWDQAAKTADHLKCCSCHSCGNLRRTSSGIECLTLQERRQADILKSEV